jgi:hypothetical protein
MSDEFHSLTEAFAELERRADAAGSEGFAVPPVRRRARIALVAASVVGVAALAVGSTEMLGGSDDSSHAPGAGAQPNSTTTPTQPASSQAAPSTSAPSTSAPSTSAPPIAGSSISIPSTSAPPSSGAGAFHVPRTAHELAHRFRVVLDGSATFSLIDAGVHGAFITGTITTKSGVTGGFDLQIFQNEPGGKATCEDPGLAICTVRRLDDGSSLATGHEPLDSNGVTYQADLVRPDGIDLHMHVSNERDPKGGGDVLAAYPPLSIDDMVAIFTSNRW